MNDVAMERAEALEHEQMEALGERFIQKSWLFHLADGDDKAPARARGQQVLMGEDPRLPPMPDAPTLMDFFRLRFSPSQQHLLQSALLARKNGLPDKMVLACLLHDIGTAAFIRSDHGYWGAQLIEPYVDEEITWAVRMHQALKFFPDPEIGYEYPASYREMFGEDYQPAGYIRAAYEEARNHRWYMSARIICMNDDYAFNPDLDVSLDEFEDVIGRHFRQPKEGLGNDNSASAHMWRTLRRPCNAL
ncbi:MAG: HD domain-containing protein [Pseudomonadota bacterium]